MSATPVISGTTRLYGILGDPIAQVQSPEYFNAWYAQNGIDAVMVPLHVKPVDFAAAIATFRRMPNIHGLIATIPHKADLMAAMDAATERARLCGGVNVARPAADGRWHGDMLDGLGFLNGLRRHGLDARGARVQMLGAGGVARAIAVALAEAGIASLELSDLDPARAEALARVVVQCNPAVQVRVGHGDVAAATMVVNATPLGMRPDDPLPFDVDRLRAGTIACDVPSKPAMTRFVTLAKARGCPITNGRDLFEGQAEAMVAFFGW